MISKYLKNLPEKVVKHKYKIAAVIKKVKEYNPYGVILGKALYEGLVSIEEAKTI